MKTKKTLKKIGYVLLSTTLILIIAVVLLFHLYGSKIIKVGIETGGEFALKVPVSVDDVSLSILGGNAGLKNLAISNPPKKYEHEHMLALGNGQIRLKVKSVFSDTIEIESILLEDIEIVMEKEKLGLGNNVQDILNNLPTEEEESPEPKESAGKNLLIRKLEIRNATVSLQLLHIKGKLGTAPLLLDEIILTDLGKDKKLNVAKLTGIIIKALVGGIMDKGKGVIPQDILGPLGNTLDTLTDVSGQILKEGGNVIKGGAQGADDAIKGIGGLFKSKDKDGKSEEAK